MKINTVCVAGVVLGDGMTKTAVPITAGSRMELERQLRELKSVSFDLAEWRADLFFGRTRELWQDEGLLKDILAQVREGIGREKPLLFTWRNAREGGEMDLSLDEYGRLLGMAARSGEADLVDVEIRCAGRAEAEEIIAGVHEEGCLVVGSAHFFEETPSVDVMTGLLCRMQEMGTDVTKLAVMPRCRMDVVRLLEASVRMKDELADRPFITMAMGQIGRISRVSGCLTGSALSFASAVSSSAPGQMNLEKTKSILDILEASDG